MKKERVKEWKRMFNRSEDNEGKKKVMKERDGGGGQEEGRNIRKMKTG